MALIKCADCGKEVSDSAPTCPGCGKPIKPQRKQTSGCAMGCLAIIVFGVLITALVSTTMPPGSSSSKPVPRPTPKVLSPQEKRLGEIPITCSGTYLKTHIFGTPKAPPCAVELLLSKTLKDPDSFQMDQECTMLDGKTSWVARCDYRSRNSFGGMVRATTDFYIKENAVVKVVEHR